MNHWQSRILRSFAYAITFASMAALTACNDEKKEPKQPEPSSSATPVESDDQNYDQLNATLIAKFPSSGQGDESSYLDILRPETPFRLYNNLRTWDEDGKDIASLLETWKPHWVRAAMMFLYLSLGGNMAMPTMLSRDVI